MNEANSEGRGLIIGQKNADGHSGMIRVPNAQHARVCLIISTTTDTGGQSQLFSPRQSWDKLSTAQQPGDKNLELNVFTCAL